MKRLASSRASKLVDASDFAVAPEEDNRPMNNRNLSFTDWACLRQLRVACCRSQSCEVQSEYANETAPGH